MNYADSELGSMHVKVLLEKVARYEKAFGKAQLLQTPPSGQVWKSYYFAGSVRIAMRVQVNGAADQVYYLLTDHLGSTTVSYRADGQETRFQSYKPWGELRPGPGTGLPTDRTFTGQRWSASIGLSFFNARWFDSSLGRFISPDIIIPGMGNPQAWDRYAGLGNNPMKYIDPSGHEICDADGNCGVYKEQYKSRITKSEPEKYWKDMIQAKFGASIIEGAKTWGEANLRTIYYGLSKITKVLELGFTAFEGVTFKLGEHVSDGRTRFNGEVSNLQATFLTTGNNTIPTHHFYHEFGHVLDNLSGEMYVTALGGKSHYVNGAYVFGGKGIGNINKDAFISYPNVTGVLTLQHISSDPGEQWADIFANFMSNNINTAVDEGRELMFWISNMLYPFP